MIHNVTEIQQRLIDLKFLPALKADGLSNADGRFGTDTLDAYNRFRASKGEPPHTGVLLLTEISADVFPEDAPPPKPVSNPLDNPLVKLGLSLLLPQILKGLPMGNIFNVLAGAKTYILGVAFFLIGAAAYGGWIIPGTGNFEPGAWIAVGLTLIAGRNALATSVIAILEKLEGVDTSKLPPAP